MNIKKYIFSSIVAFLVVSLFFSISSVEAASKKIKSILQDNFNQYTNGVLVGQGEWFDRANGTSYVVQNTIVKEGRKAIYSNNTSADSVITKNSGKQTLADGRQSFWIYPKDRTNWGTYNIGENVQMGVFQGSWDGATRTVMAFMKDGHVAYIDPRPDRFVEFDTFLDNTWNLAEIEWRSIDQTARFRVNNGIWTNWIPLVGASSFTGFDTVGFVTFFLGTGGVYIDDLK